MATVDTSGKQEQPRATVRLPFGAPEVKLPRLALPARDEVTAVLDTARSFLPPPRQIVYFGALGVLTAVELIEWPVAVAIGVGTAVAGRGAESRAAKPEERTAPKKPAEMQRAPQERVQLAGQPETAGAHRPTKPVTAGKRPTPAGQPEVAGAHHALAERTPKQAAQPAPAKPEPAPVQKRSPAEPTPAKLQPTAPAPAGATAKPAQAKPAQSKPAEQDGNPAPGGE
ncbi:hypothetical protein [Amycolatopsis sp. FDAARGOS 1241]|uniref:hypothetical protein n=1 Tax=Amycolatopsis sp. FDAARGOS 1241 TaxID=2778070 RepID=UPI0019525EE1|nr:hypothetical protein [Amycolatopsis sp. FDAARGOS 1241]QRP50421.1 hypothetical protein I6J71_23660 [Amycolatopsis sp. FDAARGOS 1241]